MKWVRDMLKVLKEKFKEPEPEEPKPEPTTEILFLCSYEGCNKAFPNEGAYRQHAHTHGERQYACSFPGCGKKFLDSSKLKRHQVIHTGGKNFVCSHEGCGKVILFPSSDIWSVGRFFFFFCSWKYTRSSYVIHSCRYLWFPFWSPIGLSSRSCGKDYIHEYKLNEHLKTQHPGHNPEDNIRRAPAVDNTMDEISDQGVYIAKGGVAKNSQKQAQSAAQNATYKTHTSKRPAFGPYKYHRGQPTAAKPRDL